MILAFDTYYFDNKAKTVCLAFKDWADGEMFETFSEIMENVEEYIPGEFYKRELPCILSLLYKMTFQHIEAIIVDGYVYLDDSGKFGLGGYLFNALGQNIPIIGVAKNSFATIDKNKRVLLRGMSEKPLYITSIGVDLDLAAKFIRTMSGNFRVPTLLKQLDILTKSDRCG